MRNDFGVHLHKTHKYLRWVSLISQHSDISSFLTVPAIPWWIKRGRVTVASWPSSMVPPFVCHVVSVALQVLISSLWVSAGIYEWPRSKAIWVTNLRIVKYIVKLHDQLHTTEAQHWHSTIYLTRICYNSKQAILHASKLKTLEIRYTR